MFQVFTIISQISALFGTDLKAVVQLFTKIIAAAKAKDYATVATLIMELITLIAKPKPAPVVGTPPVFASAASEESAVVSQAVSAGCPQSDIEALVNELK